VVVADAALVEGESAGLADVHEGPQHGIGVVADIAFPHRPLGGPEGAVEVLVAHLPTRSVSSVLA